MQVRTLTSRCIKKIMDENIISILLNRIKSTFQNRDVTIVNIQNTTRFNYKYYTLADKYNYIYEFFKKNNIKESGLLSQLLSIVIEKIKFSDLEGFLRTIKLYKKYSVLDCDYNKVCLIVVSVIIESSFVDISDVSEWETVINILEEIKENVSNSKIELLKGAYINNYETMLYNESRNLDNLDDVVEIISLIQKINKYFGFQDEIKFMNIMMKTKLMNNIKIQDYLMKKLIMI